MSLRPLAQEGANPIERLAGGLTKRGLETPAIFVLEAMKPFSVVTQQALFATSPLAPLFGAERLFGDLSFLLQDRQRIEELILSLEGALEGPSNGSAAAEEVSG